MKLDQLSSERLNLLRFPLIVAVVFIHAYGTEIVLSDGSVGVGDTSYLSNFVRNFISKGLAQTAVPLFFLMSGYFFFLGFSWSTANYIKKIKSRIYTLIIPFLFWNLATLLLLSLAQYIPTTQVFFSGKNVPISSFDIYDYVNAILGIDRLPISYQFWFIRDLLMMVCLAPPIYFFVKTVPKIFLVSIFVMWFFNFWLVYIPSSVAFAFFYAGAYFALSHHSLFIFDRLGIVILPFYLLILLIDTLTKWYKYNYYIHNAGVLLGVVSVLYLSKFFITLHTAKRALVWAGGYSFFIFAVHEPILTITRKITYKIVEPSTDMMSLFLYFFIPSLVLLESILLPLSIQSIFPRFLNIISGGR